MKLRTLAQAPITKGTRVLVRIDSDVAVTRGSVAATEGYRLDSAIPTLKYLLAKKAIITIIGHRGRPNGKKVTALSLAPVQKYLEGKLKIKLHFLPNVRFDSREEKNDIDFARELAAGQEVFVNESFATSHRAHASVVAITKILPAFAGLQFETELCELSSLIESPEQPLALLIGGSKLETKVPVISTFLKKADHIFVIGAAANAFFAADGCAIGKSIVDDASIAIAKKFKKNKTIVTPNDVMVGAAKGGSKFRAVALEETCELCKPNEAILDIGPASLIEMSELLAGAKTIVWNGPAGVIERTPFGLGSERIARLLSRLGRGGAHVVVGGGETVSVILGSKMQRGFSHISTGGGAMLEYLSGKKLPGVAALQTK
ncbi:MAG: phosphoglycerate kinase [Candidatus Magasanikbacteria bacterium]|nr:phosphoglycerate kinase [Candidatus Magasanikbacteria bacterium]